MRKPQVQVPRAFADAPAGGTEQHDRDFVQLLLLAVADPVVRATLFNEADKQLATNAVTSIPLFQKPTQLGYRDTITGVQDNPTQDGFTWNIEDWSYTP